MEGGYYLPVPGHRRVRELVGRCCGGGSGSGGGGEGSGGGGGGGGGDEAAGRGLHYFAFQLHSISSVNRITQRN